MGQLYARKTPSTRRAAEDGQFLCLVPGLFWPHPKKAHTHSASQPRLAPCRSRRAVLAPRLSHFLHCPQKGRRRGIWNQSRLPPSPFLHPVKKSAKLPPRLRKTPYKRTGSSGKNVRDHRASIGHQAIDVLRGPRPAHRFDRF